MALLRLLKKVPDLASELGIKDEGDDLRNRLVLLTEAGAERLAAALPAWEAAQQKLIDRLGAEKRETLLALLDELA